MKGKLIISLALCLNIIIMGSANAAYKVGGCYERSHGTKWKRIGKTVGFAAASVLQFSVAPLFWPLAISGGATSAKTARMGALAHDVMNFRELIQEAYDFTHGGEVGKKKSLRRGIKKMSKENLSDEEKKFPILFKLHGKIKRNPALSMNDLAQLVLKGNELWLLCSQDLKAQKLSKSGKDKPEKVEERGTNFFSLENIAKVINSQSLDHQIAEEEIKLASSSSAACR